MIEPILKKPMDTLEFLRRDAAAKMEYEARMKALSDEKSRMEGAMAEGEARGEARGERKKVEEISRKLLAHGVEFSIIAESSGLSEDEIMRLKKKTDPN